MSNERETHLAYALRITEPGLSETHPNTVIAEYHGAILYTAEEHFEPGKLTYPFPDVDIYESTMSKLVRIDIEIDLSVSEQVTGTPQNFGRDTSRFVGAELWKRLALIDPGCGGDSAWVFSRYHRCAMHVDEHGYLQVTSVAVPNTHQIYALRYMKANKYTPKMKGTNDE